MAFGNILGRSRTLALDLGNNNTVLTDAGRLQFSAPSFVAFNKGNKSVKAAGTGAYDMLGRIGEELKVVKPLKGGIIADYDAAILMLRSLMGQAYPKRSYFDKISQLVCGIPYSSTDVERRALHDALEQFRSRKTSLIFEPLAAAIGMGLDVQEADGKFLVDVGGGITEIALISLSGIVSYQSLEIAGDTFNEDIQQYVKKTYNVAIGIHKAELAKIRAGAALASLEELPEPTQIAGKDVTTGIPKVIQLGPAEIAGVLNDSLYKIEEAIIQTLEQCPPELAGDIYTNGIYLTGGSTLLPGFRDRLAASIKIPVHQDPTPLYSVTRGISEVLRSPEKYKAVLL